MSVAAQFELSFMKFFKSQVLFLTLLFLSFQINAQDKSTCQIGSLNFTCPKNLQVKSVEDTKDLFIAIDSKNKIYVYAFSPDKQMSKKTLINESLEKVFKNIYSTDYKEYKIKDSDDFWGDSTWSKYEVSKFAKAGLNEKKQHALHFQYVQILFNKKQIVVGFVYEMATGSNARTEFNDWEGGGNGNATSNLQELIKSITGEKRKMLTPGGPPPPAK